MAKIKNTGEDCTVPWLGGRLVMANQVVEVPDADLWAYSQQERWEPANKGSQVLHDAAYAFYNPEPLDVSAATPPPPPVDPDADPANNDPQEG